MKFIKSRNVFTSLFLMGALLGYTQELIEPVQPTPVKKDTLKKPSRQKIDGIIAVVGDYIILDSDIDMAYVELASQGASVSDICWKTNCMPIKPLKIVPL